MDTMNALILRNRFQGNTTLLDNDFIDNYMLKANGEYVKVYIFLLRHINDPSVSLSISQIADFLEHTESDILRALKYWEKEGLLSLEYNDQGEVIGLEMGKAPKKERVVETRPASIVRQTEPVAPAAEPAKTVVPAMEAQPEAVPKKASVPSQKNRKELKQILFIAEQYLQKTLSRTDVDSITYFYENLGFSADLIEYLIEYCVENGHKSMHYIQKVALSWSESNISTVEEARATSAVYNKTCYSVLNAFGIKGRAPAPTELELIKKWTEGYGFELSIVLEACNRTISAIHQPSFEYADKILTNWLSKNVHHLSDIKTLDNAFEQQKAAKKQTAPAPSNTQKNSKFRSFEERSYGDMDELTKELLHI